MQVSHHYYKSNRIAVLFAFAGIVRNTFRSGKKHLYAATLFCLCLMGTATAFAGGIPVVDVFDGAKGDLVALKTKGIKDNMYFTNKAMITTPAAKDIITFKINEESNLVLKTAFTATVTYKLTYTDKNNTATTLATNQTLTINFDPTKDKPYTAYSQFVFDNAYGISIQIVSYDYNPKTAGFNPTAALQLSMEIQPNHLYQFDRVQNAVSQFTSSTPNATTSDADELITSWSPVTGATEYDLEWSYADSYASADVNNLINSSNPSDADLDRLVYKNNASRVTLTDISNTYNIPLFYDGQGTLVYRIRSVQTQPNGQRLEAVWSKSSFYKYNGHQTNLNWQASTSYAEEGKRKSVLQYFDGSLRNRQTVTKDNSTNTTVVAETIYDYQGRPAIQVLPAPTLGNLIKYTPNFNTINNAAYDKDNFDLLSSTHNICNSAADAMSSQTGAAQYYSAGNPLLANTDLIKQQPYHKYIPDASGYPFTETQYMQDGTGRVYKQGGVGPTYQLGSNHETVYYYGNPDQNDLDPLFGNEVGDASHYFKTMVRDANGQYSISYADMHGRTIATSLAGDLPAGSPLSPLASKNSQSVTKTLTDKNNNIVKGWTIESSKGLVVTKAGTNTFNYSFNPSTLMLPGCPPGNQSIYYGCLYDLEITISGDCNNSFNGGQPLVFKKSNFTLGQIDVTAQTAQGFSWNFQKDLPEGSYTVTKKLTISTDGLNYYRDQVYLKNNICKTLDQFIQEQKTIFANLNLTCNPTSGSCRLKLGTLTDFRSAYLAENGITTTTADDETRIAAAYSAAQAECDRLAADEQNGQNEIQGVYQNMLADVTPGGQYANIDLVDKYSIFAKGPSPAYYAYANSTYQYKDALGKPVNVPLLYGGYDADQVNKPNANAFALNFIPDWATTLVQAHPEYCKYVAMRDQVGAASYAWDNDFLNTQTYAAAQAKGYLNPTGNTAFTTLYPTAFKINTSNIDPLATLNADYKTKIESFLKIAFKNGSQTASLWVTASTAAFCKDNNDLACQAAQATNPFNAATSCTADLDMAWISFRGMYYAQKKQLIQAILKNACTVDYTALTAPQTITNYDQTTTVQHTVYFDDGSKTVAQNAGLSSFDPSQIVQGDAATAEAQKQKAYASTCNNYTVMWWGQLAPCLGGKLDNVKASILKDLATVCVLGSDDNHLSGSSSINPAKTNTFNSFEDVIKFYINQYNSTAATADRIDQVTCNGLLITFPLPYSAPIPVNKPIWKKPDDCDCNQISTIRAKYDDLSGAAKDATFSDYLLRTQHVIISNGALDTLKMLCNGTYTCNFLPNPITLPPGLQCGAGDVCVSCTAVNTAYNSFKNDYPGIVPSATAAIDDDVQQKYNTLFSKYMNNRLGFAKQADEYLNFMSSCPATNTTTTDTGNCQNLQQVLTNYNNRFQSTPNPDTVHFGITEVFKDDTRILQSIYGSVFANGYAHVSPDLVAGTAYQNSQLVIQKNDTLCVNDNFTLEARFKLDSTILSSYCVGANFIFWNDVNSYVTADFNMDGTQGRSCAWGSFIRSNGVTKQDTVNSRMYFRNLLNWTKLKMSFKNKLCAVYVDDTLVSSFSYSAPIGKITRYALGPFGPGSGYLDYVKMYDSTGAIRYSEEFEDCKQSASNYPVAFSCSSDCQSGFATYFNQQKGTNYSFTQIDSLYLQTCGKHLDVCTITDTNTVTCTQLNNYLADFYNQSVKPAAGYADLDMRTLAGTKTPLNGPKGVFDVNGNLIANTIDGTVSDINNSFAQIWNSNAANQAIGVLSALPGGQFRLQLKAGQQVPCQGIVGMRYYQADVSVNNTLNKVSLIAAKGSYIDFGNGDKINVNKLVEQGSDLSDQCGLMARQYTDAKNTILKIHYLSGYAENSYYLTGPYTPRTRMAVTHTYNIAATDMTTYTLTVYHSDIKGVVGFAESRHLTQPSTYSNQRGYFPQELLEMDYSGTRDSTINTTKNIKNFKEINTIETLRLENRGIDAGDVIPFLYNNFESFENNKNLQYVRLIWGLKPWVPNNSDTNYLRSITMKPISTVLPDWKNNFKKMSVAILYGWTPFEKDFDNINYESPFLKWIEFTYNYIKAYQIDTILNQIDRGSLQKGGNLGYNFYFPSEPPTAASQNAISSLVNKGWSLTGGIVPTAIPQPNTCLADGSDIFKDNGSDTVSSAFTDYINARLNANLSYQQVRDLYMNKCGKALDVCGYTPPADTCAQNLTFIKTYSAATGTSNIYDIRQTADGGYVTTGYTNGTGIANNDAHITKVNPKGDVEWSKTYGSSQYDYLGNIQLTADGGYIAIGTSNSNAAAQNGQIWVLKTDKNGTKQWSKNFGGTSGGNLGNRIIQTSDGGYAFNGYYNYIPGVVDYVVVKLTPSGDIAWSKQLGSSSSDQPGAIMEEGDSLVVTSNYWNGNSYDVVLAKLGKNNGTPGHAVAYDIQSSSNYLWDIFKSGSGYSFYGLIADGPGYNPYANMVTLAADGTPVKSIKVDRAISSEANNGGVSLRPTPDGGFVMAEGPDNSEGDIYVQKTDAAGNVTWANRIKIPGKQTIGQIIQTTDGSYLLGGTSGNNMLLIKTNAAGNTLCSDSSLVIANTTPSITVLNNNYVYTVNQTPALTVTNTTDSLGLLRVFNQSVLCMHDPCAASDNGPMLCGRNEALVKTIDNYHEGTPCDDSLTFSITRGTDLYNVYTEQLKGNFTQSYLAECMKAVDNETFTVTQTVSEYHYTLYYYDQAGNLVKTVPPAGVQPNYDPTWLQNVKTDRINHTTLAPLPAHTLVTNYRYNTLNQVMAQSTPDAGISNFWYDRLGRLAISQNAKQKAESNNYSYTKYDYLGRITEVGQINTPGASMTDAISRAPKTLDTWFTNNATKRQQITSTQYDLPGKDLSPYVTIVPRNLRNRVAFTSFTSGNNTAAYNTATYYNYDIHGNVSTLLQDYGTTGVMYTNGQQYKRIDYQYDLISGKVNEVAYQNGYRDQFFHRYTYDAQNRLTAVLTSFDYTRWEQEVNYQYYKHGLPARTEIGNQHVQGMDYAYTLQGWLKGVNGTSMMSPTTPGIGADMGNDGTASNSTRAYDAYGFSLHYFDGDYQAIGTPQWFTGLKDKLQPLNAYRPLYNGNISSMAVNLPLAAGARGASPVLYNYTYDQLNRLVAMDAFTGNNTGNQLWDAGLTATDQWKESITYDANGNIQTYNRNGDSRSTAAGFGTTRYGMDKLGYVYKTGTNQLLQVTDAVTTTLPTDYNDIKTQAANNYAYDAIGNLTKDASASIPANGITWSVYGKILSIAKTGTPITYTYDAAGNRISKTVGAITTWYVRDDNGNVMAVYTVGDNTVNSGKITLREQYIYGRNRFGTLNPNLNVSGTGGLLIAYTSIVPTTTKGFSSTFERGKKFFELTNHLGNVLITISDKKIGTDNNNDGQIDYYNADVANAQDYYDGGMQMPGRKYQPNGRNRYEYQGQETDKEFYDGAISFEYRVEDPRIVRFLSVDPLDQEFPWNSPYSVQENKFGMGTELEGRELFFGTSGLTLSNSSTLAGASELSAAEAEGMMVNGAGRLVPLTEPLTAPTQPVPVSPVQPFQPNLPWLFPPVTNFQPQLKNPQPNINPGQQQTPEKQPQPKANPQRQYDPTQKPTKEDDGDDGYYIYETASSEKIKSKIVKSKTPIPYYGITGDKIFGGRYSLDNERVKNFKRIIGKTDYYTAKGVETALILLNTKGYNSVIASTRIDNKQVSTRDKKRLISGILWLRAHYGNDWQKKFNFLKPENPKGSKHPG